MTEATRGILAMSASVVVFILNDAFIKLAAESLPSLQAIGLRGVFATGWCALALLLSGDWRRLPWAVHPQVLLRGALEAVSAIVFLVALFRIPFAIASAVNLAMPLLLTLLAVLILKETVRWRRWTAIAVGFAGVLLVIQPRPGELNAWTWVALAGTCLSALRDVLSRYLPRGVPSLVVSFATAAIVAVVACAGAVVEGWQPMPARAVGYVAISALLLAAGYQFLLLALRSGAELSVIGAFRYGSILWALAIGYVVWGDVPDRLALVGIAAIVGSGLYILHRERVRR